MIKLLSVFSIIISYSLMISSLFSCTSISTPSTTLEPTQQTQNQTIETTHTATTQPASIELTNTTPSVTTTTHSVSTTTPIIANIVTTTTPSSTGPTTATPTVFPLLEYKSKLSLYRISYPLLFTINDSDPYTVTISDATGGISILIDKLAVSVTLKNYFDLIAAGKKNQIPTWSADSINEIEENGEITGYKYDYTNIISDKKWIGKGMVYKKGGFGFYVVFTTPEDYWEQNKETAVHCLDSFVLSNIYSDSYSNTSLGISISLPKDWCLSETKQDKQNDPALKIFSPYNQNTIAGGFYIKSVSSGTTAEQFVTKGINAGVQLGITKVQSQGTFTFSNGTIGYKAITVSILKDFDLKSILIVMVKGNKVYQFDFTASPSDIDALSSSIEQLAKTLVVQ